MARDLQKQANRAGKQARSCKLLWQSTVQARHCHHDVEAIPLVGLCQISLLSRPCVVTARPQQL